eukprot:1192383-Prorocentrum_minimum.AAC.4
MRGSGVHGTRLADRRVATRRASGGCILGRVRRGSWEGSWEGVRRGSEAGRFDARMSARAT